ncbi:hypothetical protein WAI453_011654 [Rhynchosporium graminicola]|uniref:Uncharacterized protein n=1 Tax=Rhynchosporium graminicola TaxID=2792576 RepID=A0A1E1LTG0_9HELO|nr:uncharacterized protein RCO7_07118 [Rhynchosporium commune]
MKHLSILLACVTAAHAYQAVVCTTFEAPASVDDAEWALVHRRQDLALEGKGLWGVRRTTCGKGINVVPVVTFCRSDPYPDIKYTNFFPYGGSIQCFPTSGKGSRFMADCAFSC